VLPNGNIYLKRPVVGPAFMVGNRSENALKQAAAMVFLPDSH
jgi:hypothetical protein